MISGFVFPVHENRQEFLSEVCLVWAVRLFDFSLVELDFALAAGSVLSTSALQ